MPLDQAEASRLVQAMLGKVAYVAPTTPMKNRLMTTNGSASSNGTEVVNSGGSTYASQDASAATPAGATNGVIANNSAITYTNMPDTTANPVKGVELWDSAGSPRRACYGPLTANKTTALGDSLTFAAGALQFTMA